MNSIISIAISNQRCNLFYLLNYYDYQDTYILHFLCILTLRGTCPRQMQLLPVSDFFNTTSHSLLLEGWGSWGYLAKLPAIQLSKRIRKWAGLIIGSAYPGNEKWNTRSHSHSQKSKWIIHDLVLFHRCQSVLRSDPLSCPPHSRLY